jgi:uncharacterized protein YndB with AHSA1/START domain
MSVVRQTIDAPLERVFSALCDPRTYPQWLIGAKEIRAVDDGWPEPGTRFHHRVGIVGPLTVADNTRSLELDAPRRLVLEVRARPLGRGRVTFTLGPAGTSGSAGSGTEVVVEERPIGALSGFRAFLDPMLTARNTASLQKLAAVIEDGALERTEPSGDHDGS